MTKKKWQKEVDEVINLLSQSASQAFLLADLIHFQKQISYGHFKDNRVIGTLYTDDELAKLFADIEGKTGLSIPYDSRRKKYNASHKIYKNELAKQIRKTADTLGRIVANWVPQNTHGHIRNSLFVHPGELKVFNSDYVKEFIASYYWDDIALYESITCGLGK